MQTRVRKHRRAQRVDVDTLLGTYIVEGRKAQASGNWNIVFRLYDMLIVAGVDIPLPPGVEIAFSLEDAIRARGMGIRLD